MDMLCRPEPCHHAQGVGDRLSEKVGFLGVLDVKRISSAIALKIAV